MAKSIRKLNLVILDDDPAVLRLVKTYLDVEFKNQVNLHLLSDPHDAQLFFDERCCDILLSDIEMPGMDGLEVLKIAKKRSAWTQVIFMTGHSSWDRISTAIENGATDYLVKPLNREQLINTVRYQLERLTRWQAAALETLHRKNSEREKLATAT